MAAPVVPIPVGDTPIRGLLDLLEHLDAILRDPFTDINAKLFDDVELQLNTSNSTPFVPLLLPRVVLVLHATRRDPTPVASLATKLVSVQSFRQLIEFASGPGIIQALLAPLPSLNLLGMEIVHRAASGPAADRTLLARETSLIDAFLTCWLASENVSVSEKGGRILGDLLDLDSPEPPPPRPSQTNGIFPAEDSPTWIRIEDANYLPIQRREPGTGDLWGVVFARPEAWSIIVSYCTRGIGPDPTADAPDERQASLAQGRILRLLPRLGPNYLPGLIDSTFHEPLIQFACRMVDKEDVLMHLSIVDFWEALFSLLRLGRPLTDEEKAAIRGFYVESSHDDRRLRDAIRTLPDRTIPEEGDLLEDFIKEVLGDALSS